MDNQNKNLENPSKDYLEGEKRLEITVYLSEVNSLSEKTLSEKFKAMSKKVACDLLSKVYQSLGDLVAELESSDEEKAKEFLSCLNSSDKCQTVYYACGMYNCAPNYGRVTYYCSNGTYSNCQRCY